jgi:isoleucyl-tRNA synthetase
MTLYTALQKLIRVAAPFVPFITEMIYQNMVRTVDQAAPASVHLAGWPQLHPEWEDAELEDNMNDVLKIVELGRAARNLSEMKNRQPLARMYVKAEREPGAEYVDIIKSELNIRELSFIEDDTTLQDYRFKPQLRLLGKLLGKNLPAVSAALSELDGRTARAALTRDGYLDVTAAGETYRLTEEQLIIETVQAEGLATQSDAGFTVALDLALTPELIEEGYVREVISKIQNMRKDSGFDVSDRISLRYRGSDTIEEVIRRNRDEICGEVLAVDVVCCDDLTEEDGREWNLNGELCRLCVSVTQQNRCAEGAPTDET